MLKLLLNVFFGDKQAMFVSENQLVNLPGIITGNEKSVIRGETAITGGLSSFLKPRDASSIIKFILPGVIRCTHYQLKSVDSLRKNPKNPKTTTDSNFISLVEAKAKEFGASAIGYTIVPRETIFKGKGILYENAIVITVPMDKQKMCTAPSAKSFETIVEAYADGAYVSAKLADFLRENGYGAQAGVALSGLTAYQRLAEDSGIGIRGRQGNVISPVNGPSQRISVVYTSIANLPFDTENPHIWVRDFCNKCGKCIKSCPGQAIYEKPIPSKRGQNICIDEVKCKPQWDKYACGVCIKVCPFTTIGYDKIKASFVK